LLNLVRETILKPGQAKFIIQDQPLGLGHAVWCARHELDLEQEAVAVILPDDLILNQNGPGCLKQMIEVYGKAGGNIAAVENVPKDQTNRYGILDVVEDDQARKLLAKGANHREMKVISWSDVEEAAAEALETFLSRIRKKFRKTNEELQMFQEYFKNVTTKRIEYWKARTERKEAEEPIDPNVFRKLMSKYIITVADKAGNNFIIVCKKYYMLILCKEMGISKDNDGKLSIAGNNVYSFCDRLNTSELMEKHKAISKIYGISVPEDELKLPIIFATGKLHKNPYKARFIASSRQCSTKRLSVLLSNILSHFRKHLAQYCKTIETRTGVRAFWSVDGSLQVINKMQQKKAAHHVTTADFSTLYTSLPHSKIRLNMFKLIDLLFRNSGQPLLAVMNNKERTCRFTSDKPQGCIIVLNAFEIRQLLEHVLTNAFVKFAGFTFRQTTGIPMGTNCSPLIADLTLAMMEFTFMTDPRNNDVRFKLKHTDRYMDDLKNLDCKEFMEICQRIYPRELPLNQTSVTGTKCAYLDIDIELKNGDIITSIYNKTDDFNFEVVRYVSYDSNTSVSVGLNTFYSQLVRIGRICSEINGFRCRTTELYNAFRKKNYNRKILVKRLLEFMFDYRALVFKYGLVSKRDQTEFVTQNLVL